MTERMTDRMTTHFASALIGTMMLAVALPAPASAQQSDPSARTAQSEQGAAIRPASKPVKTIVRTGAAPHA
jgi:hypothetical protein